MTELVNIECKTCCVCQGKTILQVPLSGFILWQSGAYVQDAFPSMSPGDRELLISGTHDDCFNDLFPPDDDEIAHCDDLGCADVGIGIVHHPYCGMKFSEMEKVPNTPEEEETFPPDPKRDNNEDGI